MIQLITAPRPLSLSFFSLYIGSKAFELRPVLFQRLLTLFCDLDPGFWLLANKLPIERDKLTFQQLRQVD
jgi:hypothetical protein